MRKGNRAINPTLCGGPVRVGVYPPERLTGIRMWADLNYSLRYRTGVNRKWRTHTQTLGHLSGHAIPQPGFMMSLFEGAKTTFKSLFF